MGKGQELYKKAKKIIPGGTQLLSKRPEQFLPDFWPAYFSRALGCKVWDLDGKEYTDMSYMGIGANPLGYADPDVNAAVKKVIDSGNQSTLNPPEEVELAELLLEIHPWADMARFARCGGEGMAIAVRIARAHTKKDTVLFCGYHGWHDWYLAANLADDKALDGQLLPGLQPNGVPRGLKGTALPFSYNETESFLKLVEKNKGKIAAIIIEPVRSVDPDTKFIKTIMKTAKDEKIILIVDEVTAAFRMNTGGAHLIYGINPDIAVFAKAISNGYPMAAIIGKKKVMSSAQDTFISSTYWTERVGPTAALATIKKFRKNNVGEYLIKTGRAVKEGWQKSADKHNVKIHVDGADPIAHFSFDYKNPLVPKTLFTQFMLEDGFLATTAFYASYAHTSKDIKAYLEATDKAFAKISEAILRGNLEKLLKGDVCQSGFKRLT
jgi:glutamate-1-semialdehyde aminotransferase